MYHTEKCFFSSIKLFSIYICLIVWTLAVQKKEQKRSVTVLFFILQVVIVTL